MVTPPETWRAAVCRDSPNVSKAIRKVIDNMGWEYERDRSHHNFSRLMLFITMPQMSYVFQFLVRDPVEIVINCYDERPTHASDIHYLEIKGLTKRNAPMVRKMLQGFVDELGMRPYDFHWKERFRAGLLARPHMEARREWSRWGI
jgi:hypothetical protein